LVGEKRLVIFEYDLGREKASSKVRM
jgi:hypothetical protein